MEYDEHEDQEEEIEIQPPPNYDSPGRLKMGSSGCGGVEGGVPPPTNSGRKGGGTGGGTCRYRECQKNHAVNIGAHAVDGCAEFMAAGEEGTLDALKCAACNCHRNFHRKESEGEAFHHPHAHPHAHHHQHHFAPYYRTAPPAGYLHVTPPPHQRPLALPSTSQDEEDMSNPSSSGGAVGGGGGSGGGGGGRSGSKKRFRTKFTPDQKDKMLEFAERVEWRIQKQDEEAVQQFCGETGVKRHVLKVWMHNNKHTLGKKP